MFKRVKQKHTSSATKKPKTLNKNKTKTQNDLMIIIPAAFLFALSLLPPHPNPTSPRRFKSHHRYGNAKAITLEVRVQTYEWKIVQLYKNK